MREGFHREVGEGWAGRSGRAEHFVRLYECVAEPDFVSPRNAVLIAYEGTGLVKV